jgi:hypothetical protein
MVICIYGTKAANKTMKKLNKKITELTKLSNEIRVNGKATNRMKPIAGSKRAGKSHKSWFGVFSPNTCIARLQANIQTFGAITCEYCLETLSETPCTPLKVYQLDHFTPVAWSDANNSLRNHSVMNAVISCPKCNLAKGKKLPVDFCNAETIERIESICKLAASYTKADYNELGKLLSMQSAKVARLYAGGMYKRIYWSA